MMPCRLDDDDAMDISVLLGETTPPFCGTLVGSIIKRSEEFDCLEV
jgi:hypothetical protein